MSDEPTEATLISGSHDPALLALDTATPTARVALVTKDGRTLAGGSRTSTRHAGSLLPLIDEVLRAAGVELGALAAIACGAGPGSFTGLRVGLAVAKGLCFGADRPLVLVPSLEALAWDLARVPARAAARPLLVPCLDAGKDEVYAALFAPNAAEAPSGLDAPGSQSAEHAEQLRLSDDWVLAPAQLVQRVQARMADTDPSPIVCGGTGFDRYREQITAAWPDGSGHPSFPGPSAQAIAALAWRRVGRGERDDLDAAVPIYGRPPDITLPRAAMAR